MKALDHPGLSRDDDEDERYIVQIMSVYIKRITIGSTTISILQIIIIYQQSVGVKLVTSAKGMHYKICFSEISTSI